MLRERLNTVEMDVEPDGRISEAFEQIEQHLERHDKKNYSDPDGNIPVPVVMFVAGFTKT